MPWFLSSKDWSSNFTAKRWKHSYSTWLLGKHQPKMKARSWTPTLSGSVVKHFFKFLWHPKRFKYLLQRFNLKVNLECHETVPSLDHFWNAKKDFSSRKKSSPFCRDTGPVDLDELKPQWQYSRYSKPRNQSHIYGTGMDLHIYLHLVVDFLIYIYIFMVNVMSGKKNIHGCFFGELIHCPHGAILKTALQRQKGWKGILLRDHGDYCALQRTKKDNLTYALPQKKVNPSYSGANGNHSD